MHLITSLPILPHFLSFLSFKTLISRCIKCNQWWEKGTTNSCLRRTLTSYKYIIRYAWTELTNFFQAGVKIPNKKWNIIHCNSFLEASSDQTGHFFYEEYFYIIILIKPKTTNKYEEKDKFQWLQFVAKKSV